MDFTTGRKSMKNKFIRQTKHCECFIWIFHLWMQYIVQYNLFFEPYPVCLPVDVYLSLFSVSYPRFWVSSTSYLSISLFGRTSGVGNSLMAVWYSGNPVVTILKLWWPRNNHWRNLVSAVFSKIILSCIVTTLTKTNPRSKANFLS